MHAAHMNDRIAVALTALTSFPASLGSCLEQGLFVRTIVFAHIFGELSRVLTFWRTVVCAHIVSQPQACCCLYAYMTGTHHDAPRSVLLTAPVLLMLHHNLRSHDRP